MYNEGDLQKIGANIRLMRAIRGIGQSEMAKALGISQTHMSNIEHNRASANLRLLLKAANVFQCSLDDFLPRFLLLLAIVMAAAILWKKYADFWKKCRAKKRAQLFKFVGKGELKTVLKKMEVAAAAAAIWGITATAWSAPVLPGSNPEVRELEQNRGSAVSKAS